MKSMLAVAQLISRQKLRKMDVLTEDVLNAKNSKFRELYVGLRDGTIKSDREAAQQLYNAGPSDTRYRQLKSRFRKRLLNTLFFVDQSKPHRSSFDQTYHNCQREWSLINILRGNGAHGPALQMAKSLLTVCQNYGFAELTVQTARFLANSAAEKGDTKSSARLHEIIDSANQIYQFELNSESILRKARLLFNSTHAETNLAELERDVHHLQIEIDYTIQAADSAVLYYNHLETSCILARTLNNKKRVIQLVDEVIAYSMVSPRQMEETRVWKLCMWQVETQIERRDKVEGLEALHHLEARCKTGTDQWFKVQRASIALMIAVGEPLQAIGFLEKAMNHRNFKRLTAQAAEVFKLMEILAICFDLDWEGKLKQTHKRTITSFLKKDATFGGDLQNLNAWRYLLKAILQHKMDNREALSETISELRRLSVKQLNAKENKRLIAIAHLLYRSERKNFDGHLDRIGERYFDQLQMTHFQCSLRPNSFNPVDVEDLLVFFGINEISGLPV